MRNNRHIQCGGGLEQETDKELELQNEITLRCHRKNGRTRERINHDSDFDSEWVKTSHGTVMTLSKK